MTITGTKIPRRELVHLLECIPAGIIFKPSLLCPQHPLRSKFVPSFHKSDTIEDLNGVRIIHTSSARNSGSHNVVEA